MQVSSRVNPKMDLGHPIPISQSEEATSIERTHNKVSLGTATNGGEKGVNECQGPRRFSGKAPHGGSEISLGFVSHRMQSSQCPYFGLKLGTFHYKNEYASTHFSVS